MFSCSLRLVKIFLFVSGDWFLCWFCFVDGVFACKIVLKGMGGEEVPLIVSQRKRTNNYDINM